MALSFEPRNEDGSPRLYVGMFKPPFEEFLKEHAYQWPLWYHRKQAQDAWSSGYGDKPLYEDNNPPVVSTEGGGQPDATEQEEKLQ